MKAFTLAKIKETYHIFRKLADDTEEIEQFMTQKDYVETWVGCFIDFLSGVDKDPFGDKDEHSTV